MGKVVLVKGDSAVIAADSQKKEVQNRMSRAVAAVTSLKGKKASQLSESDVQKLVEALAIKEGWIDPD
jgi:predicted regulator of Ras-like GTPase activity (Roadblock/LC7/MglB family)